MIHCQGRSTSSRSWPSTDTRVGRPRSMFAPSPSCPSVLRPQHSSSAHECSAPAPSTCAPRARTRTGDATCSASEPMPTCPRRLSPQQKTPLEGRLRHECSAPSASKRLAGPGEGARTATGATSAPASTGAGGTSGVIVAEGQVLRGDAGWGPETVGVHAEAAKTTTARHSGPQKQHECLTRYRLSWVGDESLARDAPSVTKWTQNSS